MNSKRRTLGHRVAPSPKFNRQVDVVASQSGQGRGLLVDFVVQGS